MQFGDTADSKSALRHARVTPPTLTGCGIAAMTDPIHGNLLLAQWPAFCYWAFGHLVVGERLCGASSGGVGLDEELVV
jgi:hypothetical protein